MLLAADPTLAPAVQALDAGRPADARPLLEQRVAQRPADREAWALLARLHWLLRDPAKAAAAARQADVPATPPAALHALALYYAQAGNRARAAQLESQYALSPEADAYAPARAALLHAELGHAAEAVRFGELADRATPRPEVVAMLARLYEARQEIDKAVARYEQWVRLQPAEEVYSQAGQAMLRTGRFAQA